MSGSERVCAVIVAGGVGSRFGNPGGKQLIDLCGRPLLYWSVAAFARSSHVGHIVLVLPEEHAERMRAAAIDPFDFGVPITYARAGAERQDSTRAGIEAVPGGFDVVAIHDSARPLVRPATIDAVIEALLADSSLAGAVCAQPSVDTLKLVNTDCVIEGTPDRSRYWCVQTPQVFRLRTVRDAHERARARGYLGTDDASLVEAAGGRVACVESPRDNMKVTLPEDLCPMAAIMRERLELAEGKGDDVL
ncbi:MAG: 2-C-methyl-D-erythritol 4-phosphate cytidylyltransferase [Coriobacteriaceae bacterium]|nr:2-C-methyl-D-erythritol 4-phosphate cytidylyltransferase [Coriobacteriaceae bacterium]